MQRTAAIRSDACDAPDSPDADANGRSDPLDRPGRLVERAPEEQSLEEQRLVDAHRAIAVRLARRWSHGPAPDPDLLQVAMLGLVLAARRYRPEAGPFRPFAVATVSGELKRHLRNTGWWLHIPRRVQEQAAVVDRCRDDLRHQLGRSPSAQEIAEAAALTLDEALDALRALDLRFRSDGTGQAALEVEPAAPADTADDESLTGMVVRSAVAELSATDQRLVHLRFGQELTQREIAAELHISQTQVMRRLHSLMDRLRAGLAGLDS